MKVRKAVRLLFIILISIFGVIVLLFTCLNLPFTQRFATIKANQILKQSNLPIHIDTISRILPNSIRIQGIVIADLNGDTIIHISELRTKCRLVALMRKKVVLQDLEVNQTTVELLMNYKTHEYNIEETFTSGTKPEEAKEAEGKASWVISIKKGNLSSTFFSMTDSISGIHILQNISGVGLKDFSLSLTAQEIVAHTLELEGAAGNVTLSPHQADNVDEIGSPWNFGLLNLAMKDINFTYSTGNEGLTLEMILREGTIKANQMDMRSKVVDMKRISLAGATTNIFIGAQSDKPKVNQRSANDNFPWHFKSKLIDLEDVNLNVEYEDAPGVSIAGIEMKLKGFQLDEDHAGVEVDKMSFAFDNGFTVKEIKGKLDSDEVTTKLNLAIETGYSRLKLEGEADEDFFGIISNQGEVEKANMAISETNLSLKDISYFISELQDQPFFTTLASRPFSVGCDIDIVKSAYSFSGISIAQDGNFNITIDGSAINPFQPFKAMGNLDLGISDVNMVWLNELLAGFGLENGFPKFESFTLNSHISGTSNSPDFNLKLMSNLGNIDGSGSVDFKVDSFSVRTSFDEVLLGEILNNPEFGSLTGSAEVSGKGFSLDTLHSNILLLVDSLMFHDYTYTHASVEGKLQSDEYEFSVQVDDSSLDADLTAILNPGDSIFRLQASGTVFAQLNKLHFYKDTLSVETSFAADLIKSRNSLETDFSLSNLILANPQDSTDIHQISAFFKTDSLFSTLKAEADFLHVDLKVAHPFAELGTIGKEYWNYLATFTDPHHINASTRVLELPEIYATGEITYHNAMGLFIRDTTFRFNDLGFSIMNVPSDQKINYNIRGSGVEYKVVELGNLNTIVSDSAGILNLQIFADDNSINSIPVNKIQLNSHFSEGQSITGFTIQDNLDEIVYGLEISAILDSNNIAFAVPSKQLILNHEHWQMDTSALMRMDLDTKRISPELKMHSDSSILHLFTESQEGIFTYKGEFGNVSIVSLLREGVISGKPSGTISGTIDYSLIGNIEKKFKTQLEIEQFRWYDLKFSNIDVNGAFKIDSSKSYGIEMSALLDSSRIVLKGDKISGGTGTVHAEFSSVPIRTFQPFVKDHLSDLGGNISGNFNLSSVGNIENFTGNLYISDGNVRINTLNSKFKIPQDSVRFSGQKVVFSKFRIVDSLKNELQVDGFIDLSDRSSVTADMEISSSKLQVMNRSESDDVPLYGQIFVDSRLSVKGPLTNPVIQGKIFLSKGTEVFYRYMDDLTLSETQEIVSFVNHSSPDDPDTKPVVQPSNTLVSSSIETLVEIDPTTRINFILDKPIYNIDIMIKGGGSLNYHMQNNNQVTLSGEYEIRDGSADVKLIGWPNKAFRIAEGGFIRWEGLVDNPVLSFEAVNKVSSSYTNPVDGKQRNVDFNVILKLSNQLSDLDVLFTIHTTDQYLMSIINTMSPEEQMRQAITILLFEYIDLPGITTSSKYMSQQVNQLLASQLNQIAKTTIQGVDISFGIDTYVQASQTGAEETKTSLSYEVRKSFLNNRAQIEFSGRLNDLTQQHGATDASLNNISFEYRLDSAATKYIKVYSEHSYEDVFTGEIVKTGVGFTYRRRYRHLRDIWRGKKKEKPSKIRGK